MTSTGIDGGPLWRSPLSRQSPLEYATSARGQRARNASSLVWMQWFRFAHYAGASAAVYERWGRRRLGFAILSPEEKGPHCCITSFRHVSNSPAGLGNLRDPLHMPRPAVRCMTRVAHARQLRRLQRFPPRLHPRSPPPPVKVVPSCKPLGVVTPFFGPAPSHLDVCPANHFRPSNHLTESGGPPPPETLTRSCHCQSNLAPSAVPRFSRPRDPQPIPHRPPRSAYPSTPPPPRALSKPHVLPTPPPFFNAALLFTVHRRIPFASLSLFMSRCALGPLPSGALKSVHATRGCPPALRCCT